MKTIEVLSSPRVQLGGFVVAVFLLIMSLLWALNQYVPVRVQEVTPQTTTTTVVEIPESTTTML